MASFVATAELHGGVNGGIMPGPPPPTPSNHQTSTEDTDAALSRVLERLLTPPKLSLSRFRLPSSTSSRTPKPRRISPPVTSLDDDEDTASNSLLSAACELGFFHLTDHRVPTHLPESAIAELRTLNSTIICRGSFFRANELGGYPELEKLATSLEKVGLDLVELLLRAEGLSENPFGERPARCLIGVSSIFPSLEDDEDNENDRGDEELWMKKNINSSLPYVVCLQYKIGDVEIPWWVVGGDSTLNSVTARPDSLLVALGDAAEVWSKGRFKKIKGIPRLAPTYPRDDAIASVSVILTVSEDITVAPLTPVAAAAVGGGWRRFRALTVEHSENDWSDDLPEVEDDEQSSPIIK